MTIIRHSGFQLAIYVDTCMSVVAMNNRLAKLRVIPNPCHLMEGRTRDCETLTMTVMKSTTLESAGGQAIAIGKLTGCKCKEQRYR